MERALISENVGAEHEQPARSMAVASMIIGIISYVSINPLGAILAIIFAATAKKHGNTTGYATAGLVCGIVGFILSLAVAALAVGVTVNVLTVGNLIPFT